MPQFNQVAIIYNPNSTGDAPRNAEGLAADLKQSLSGIGITLLPTERAGHAANLAYDFARKHQRPLIISASGDGGYNEVVNGAMKAQSEGAQPICAVLPSGNANDHARTMHSKPLVELIHNDAVTHLDLLKVSYVINQTPTVRYAHSYAGIGLTPTVAVELNKHTLNSLKEAFIVVKTFWHYKPVKILVEDKKVQVDSLICSTIPEMAKVLSFSKKAHPQDGLFELTVFEHNRKLLLLLRLLKGVIGHLGAEKRLKSYAFTVVRPTPLQCDGEVIDLPKNTDVRIEICPGLLKTIALA